MLSLLISAGASPLDDGRACDARTATVLRSHTTETDHIRDMCRVCIGRWRTCQVGNGRQELR